MECVHIDDGYEDVCDDTNAALEQEGEASFEDLLFESPWDIFKELTDEMKPAPKESLILEHQRDVEAPGVSFDASDFDGPEQALFELLKTRAREACNVNSSPAVRAHALEWLFCSREPFGEVSSFALLVRALGARRQVIQARVQYQLYAAGIPSPKALPFLCDTLPEGLTNELLTHHGEAGWIVGRYLWTWPGVRADIFMEEVRERLEGYSEDRIHDLLNAMQKTGYIAIKHGFWYFISRNPDTYTLEGRRRFQWSKSFVFGFE